MTNKSIIISALVAIASVNVNAQSNDTCTVVINNAERMVISESPDGMTATIKTADRTMTFSHHKNSNGSFIARLNRNSFSLTSPKTKNGGTNWDIICGGVGFGFCSAPGATKAAGIEMGKSFELSWMQILGFKATNRHGNSFSLAVGIDWRNYRTTLSNRFTFHDGKLSAEPYPQGSSPRLSRIKVFSVQFPLLYRQEIPLRLTDDRLALSFGPVFNLNTHASVLAAWDEGEVEKKYSVKGVNIRPFSVDIFAMLHLFNWGGIYARYSPAHAINGYSPINFHPFSTGVMFFM